MNFVDPIRDLKKLSQIKNVLRAEGKIKNLLLIELGINSALRCSDLLRVRVWDVFTKEWEIREFFEMIEKKTSKKTKVTITPKVIVTLGEYKEKYPMIVENKDNYLFFAQKTFPLGSEHIKRSQSYKIINKICADVGLVERFSNHSLRKSFAYQARVQWVPLILIQKKLNHSSISMSMRYMGLDYQELASACNKLDL